ncbi:hypothetical protein CDAR_309661 [Caerostris darwini]|uniref:Centrosomin N-terminal motif 1 domain-containing protein n=1 Tax=Caerostris darwini TaxID=1538125 RepID=A0AAV4VYX8_9ARAC|nr:hypothetical protein CDAR_309661 [Caerostris darwini]
MAGCYDRSWYIGSKARGTRSQFRLNTEGLLPFKCTYPTHLTDVMDAVPSTQSDLRRADIVSPVRSTRTRAVREYEQTIEELKKENFDLKLRIFLLEDTKNKNYLRNKSSGNEDEDNTVQVIVELKVETEALRNELSSKNQLLQEAIDEKEKYAFHLKELQDKFEELQNQLSQCQPSNEELMFLKGENESLQKSNEFFTKVLTEKDQDTENLKVQMKELMSKNNALDAKNKKSSLALQGLVTKYYKDIEMVPKVLRPVVQSAVQAAKENKRADLAVAIENFKASLCELMSANGKTSSESTLNTSQGKDSMEELNQLAGISRSLEELAKKSGHSLTKSKFVHDQDVSSQSTESGKSESRQNLYQIHVIIKENEALKEDNAEKSEVIKNLKATCTELEQRMLQTQNDLLDTVSNVKNLEIQIKEEKSKHTSSLPMVNSAVQTAVQWHLMQSKISDKFLQNVGQSNDIDHLKEEILTLLLVIEQKDKELSDCEEKLASLQSQLETDNQKEITFTSIDKEFVKERDELHQRLAHSCTVNNELMKHLRNLEMFMRDLLHHRNLDSSSIENISQDSSGFLSHLKIQKAIEQSLELSNLLNDELSICETSKLFDPNEVSLNRDSLSGRPSSSYQPTDTSRFDPYISSIQGRDNSQLPPQEAFKNAAGTGKRRLSFSTLHNSSLDTTLRDPENVVVLGTSNNEDLILLLNDKGDPEDVLIRNNHSHLDKNPSMLDSGEQLRRRCWESSAMNYFNTEKSTLDHHTELCWNSKTDKMVNRYFHPYPSSDSDIWSEPDRDVSMQRIGIDLQNSPVSQKSPRRSRFREKLTTDDFSSQKNESSSSFTKLHTWSKRRKNSDTSRSSFICKKCMSHSQTSDVPTREEQMESFRKVADEFSDRCFSLEDELKNKDGIISVLTKEKQDLMDGITRLRECERQLEEKNSQSSESLSKISTEYNKLQNVLKELESRAAGSDAVCNQLKNELEKTRNQLKNLETKCKEYENEIVMQSNAKQDFSQRFKSMEGEKNKLLQDIEALIQEKNELLSKIVAENGIKKHLEDENGLLNSKLEENSREISLLKASCKNLENTKNLILEEKNSYESSLQSSNSTCNALKSDLRKMQESLEKMQTKCSIYEKELIESAKSKENIIHSLSTVKSQISSNLNALADTCKQYLSSDNGIVTDQGIISSDVDKTDQVETLMGEIILVNRKFEQTVKFLSEQLRSVQLLLEKSKTIDKEGKSKIVHLHQQLEAKEKENLSWKTHCTEMQKMLETSKSLNSEYQSRLQIAQQEVDNAEDEIKNLKEHKDRMQSLFEELQQSLKHKEEALDEFSNKNSVTEKKLANEILKYQHLLNEKDDEVTKLQEKIFNMQTYINSNLKKPAGQASALSSKDHSPPRPIEIDMISVISGSFCDDSVNNDTSINSITSEKEEDLNRKIDRYTKKIKALQTKLSLMEKRIDILEKEKADLREQLLAQPHGNKHHAAPSEEFVTLFKELEELKSTLKTKSSFIKDLKNELFKTCNSLVDKQKEVDDLQQKLSEVKSFGSLDSSHLRYSDPIHKSTEANIKDLTAHKWELIQGILKHQKQFYERKNIHLGHFEKFKNHIEKLRSLQVSPSLLKFGSDPFLNNGVASNNFYVEKCDRTLKNLQMELQLDVECLQNLKIFLKRFFMPLVLQNCACNKTNPKNDDDFNAEKYLVTEKKNFKKEHLKLDLWKTSSAQTPFNASVTSSSDRVIGTASVVAHNLDSIEIALKKMKFALEQFKDGTPLINESPKKVAAKSVLLKILNELVSLQENSAEIFHLNSTLKSLELFDISIPQSPCKQDMSDRESFLSEETIALSRSGSLSPMSFEETFPSKFVSGMKLKRESEGFSTTKQALEISQKLHPAGGSQDSLFLRSHFSSPDLGIESDPNHESSAPEQAEKDFRDGGARMSKRNEKQWTSEGDQSKSLYERTMNAKDVSFGKSDALHAIGYLQEYELLKKEVQESLVGIKAILSRAADGLQHVAKYTSPQKNLEYSTFKAIKDACENNEVCLQKASKLVDNFWIAPCPSVKELNLLIQQNRESQDKLRLLQESKRKQEASFKEVMEKFKEAERLRENMEKKISKKLVETKKVIRRAEIKILEKEGHDLPSIPKYPCDESSCQRKS